MKTKSKKSLFELLLLLLLTIVSLVVSCPDTSESEIVNQTETTSTNKGNIILNITGESITSITYTHSNVETSVEIGTKLLTDLDYGFYTFTIKYGENKEQTKFISLFEPEITLNINVSINPSTPALTYSIGTGILSITPYLNGEEQTTNTYCLTETDELILAIKLKEGYLWDITNIHNVIDYTESFRKNYGADNNTYAVKITTVENTNITINAKPITFNVTLNGNEQNYPDPEPNNFKCVLKDKKNNIINSPIIVMYDTNLEFPSAERSGWDLEGWYTEAKGGTKIESLKVKSDEVLYAHWTPQKYALSFDTKGGDNIDPKQIKYNSEYGDKLSTPVRTGYTFAGWFLDSEEIHSDSVVKTPKSHTLTAHWTPNTYTVTLDTNYYHSNANRRSNITLDYVRPSYEKSSVSVTYSEKWNLSNDPIRTGWTFMGWYTEIEKGTKVKNGTTINITKDTTLYAHWSPTEYHLNIELQLNGTKYENVQINIVNINIDGEEDGDLSSNPLEEYFCYGDTLIFTVEPLDGYEFDKWEVQKEGSDAEECTDNPMKITLPASNLSIKLKIKTADN